MVSTAIPSEIWCTVASYCAINPLDLSNFSRISSTARYAFLEDRLWARLCPVPEQRDFAAKFLQRIQNTPELWQVYRDLWKYWNTRTILSIDSLASLVPAEYLRKLDQYPDLYFVLLLNAIHQLGYDRRSLCEELNFKYLVSEAPSVRVVENLLEFEYGGFIFTLWKQFTKNRRLVLKGLQYSHQYAGLKYIIQQPWFIDNYLWSADRDMTLAACHNHGMTVVYMRNTFTDDEEIAKIAIPTYWGALYHFSDRIKDDPKIVAFALRVSPKALQYASARLRDDSNFIIQNCPQALPYASQRLRLDPQFFLDALASDPAVALHLPDTLSNNLSVLLAACDVNPLALAFASDELRNNRLLVLLAVKKNGRMLEYASQQLRCDREIVLAAIASSKRSIKFADAMLRNDSEIMYAARTSRSNSGFATYFDSTAWIRHLQRADLSTILHIVANHGSALVFVPSDLKARPEVVLTALKNNPHAFEYADDRLKDDREFVLRAMDASIYVFEHCSRAIRSDLECASKAVSQCGRALKYTTSDLRKNLELVKKAVAMDGMALRYCDEELRANREVVLTAINSDYRAIGLAPSEFLTDPVCIRAVVNSRLHAGF